MLTEPCQHDESLGRRVFLPMTDVKTRVGEATTWAKVILFGEHSVVYGYPAIALPLHDLTMRARVCAFPPDEYNHVDNVATPVDNTFSDLAVTRDRVTAEAAACDFMHRIHLKSLGVAGFLVDLPSSFAGVITAIETALNVTSWHGEYLSIETVADFPAACGLGSSAAAAGAIIRAILDYYDVTASDHELFELTQCAERVAHGQPSGLDAAATVAASPIRFHQGRLQPLAISMDAWIVLADSGEPGLTKRTVQHLRQEFDAQPDVVQPRLHQLGLLADQAETHLAHGDAASLGALMTMAQQQFAFLEISTPKLDAMIDASLYTGALGAKLTGGGGGGCMIALTQTEAVAQRVCHALEQVGSPRTWVLHLQQKERN